MTSIRRSKQEWKVLEKLFPQHRVGYGYFCSAKHIYGMPSESPNASIAKEFSSSPVFCTLGRGHKGMHVAHVSGHLLRIWEDPSDE